MQQEGRLTVKKAFCCLLFRLRVLLPGLEYISLGGIALQEILMLTTLKRRAIIK
jgi:hypothetical protein